MIKSRLLIFLVFITSTVFGQFRENSQQNAWVKKQLFQDTLLIDTNWLSPSTFNTPNLYLSIDTTGLGSTGRVFIQATQTIGGGGGGTWGSITGTLSNQTDLQTALDQRIFALQGSTDSRVLVFDSTSGNRIKESLVTINDAGAISGLTRLNMGGNSIQNVGDIDAAYGEFQSAFVDGTLNVSGATSIDGGVNLNGSDLTNVDQITQSHSASGTGVSLTHSGTGNALVINKTNSGDAVDVVSGTIRIQALTASRYLFIDANNRVSVKTTAEVLSEIGALPLAGGTMTGSILGDQRIDGYRNVGDAISASVGLNELSANTFYEISTGAVVTVTDDANKAFPIGTEFEFFNTDPAEFPSFATSGSQSLRSEREDFVTQYGHVTLKKIANNTWALYGRF